MLSGSVIKHYSPFRDTRMETNASNGVVAGVLNQLQDDGTWKLVAFFLKTISPIEMRYEIYNKEMLAVIRGL
jgi:RNase H-like domain found in reverse transcriptase